MHRRIRLSGTSGSTQFQSGVHHAQQAKMMNDSRDFEIHYQFRGESRQFSHHARHLCEREALHFATLHAGVGDLDGTFAAGPLRLAMRQAEGLGVTQVQWKLALAE
jgi:hypothetical protein